MLSRRQIRIRVLQSLYIYFNSNNEDANHLEHAMVKRVYDIYRFFIYRLSIFNEIALIHENTTEVAKKKHFVDKLQMKKKEKFAKNSVLKILTESEVIRKQIEKHKIHWNEDVDIIEKIYKEIEESEISKKYQNIENPSFSDDKKYLLDIYRNIIIQDETLQNYFDEKNVYWTDDYDVADMMLTKMLKGMNTKGVALPPLFKDVSEEDETDEAYMKKLFRKTVNSSEDFEELISAKTVNWEVDRIALLDIIIMKMAMTEMFDFKEIPVKVTINEYLEIAKEYSTPKSNSFVNGILDKVLVENKDRVKKTGRGLMK